MVVHGVDVVAGEQAPMKNRIVGVAVAAPDGEFLIRVDGFENEALRETRYWPLFLACQLLVTRLLLGETDARIEPKVWDWEWIGNVLRHGVVGIANPWEDMQAGNLAEAADLLDARRELG